VWIDLNPRKKTKPVALTAESEVNRLL